MKLLRQAYKRDRNLTQSDSDLRDLIKYASNMRTSGNRVSTSSLPLRHSKQYERLLDQWDDQKISYVAGYFAALNFTLGLNR